ncbi:MAG: hypothetical protein CMJ78_26840 [Planctomycetaceae bacterium]|nr:hypothetical protein [Planctomycetaceae bacterium]
MKRAVATSMLCLLTLSLTGCSCHRAKLYHPSGVVYSGDYTNGWSDPSTQHITGNDACGCSGAKQHDHKSPKRKSSGCSCGRAHTPAPTTSCGGCGGDMSYIDQSWSSGCSSCGGNVISSDCATCGGATETTGCATCAQGIPSGTTIQQAPGTNVPMGTNGVPMAPGSEATEEAGDSDGTEGDSSTRLRPQDVPNTNARPIQQTQYLQWVPRKL